MFTGRRLASNPNGMDVRFDLAKLVGSASAPVALIIATSIFLSNLTTKYDAMFAAARALFVEYRDDNHGHTRRRLLSTQLQLYGRRLRLLMAATETLTLSIVSFIGTVALTSISILVPTSLAWKVATAISLGAGLLLLGTAVLFEFVENRLARFALRADFDEFPELRQNRDGRRHAA
jgi:hypothetical protein